MSNLNDITLRSELVCWLFKNGRKSRNYKNQRFGQYIWNKYKWSNQKSNKDGFYDVIITVVDAEFLGSLFNQYCKITIFPETNEIIGDH